MGGKGDIAYRCLFFFLPKFDAKEMPLRNFSPSKSGIDL